MNQVHGFQKSFSVPVQKISVTGGKDGQYTIVAIPNFANEVGRYKRTGKQLNMLADSLGFQDFKTLAPAVAKGGCELMAVATWCEAGQPFVDGSGGTYGDKSFWAVDKFNLVLSDEAQAFADQVAIAMALKGETKADNADRIATQKRRIEAMTGGLITNDQDIDILDDDDDDDIDIEEAPAKKTAKKAK
tara:strand:+ start:1345 stop:1911 length:567 start_codon:yes stop_codon:yes gene_type:complete